MSTVNRFKKILIANRGEIAIRIMRAASELKLRTVAIYTFEDRYSLHRYKADEAYKIGDDSSPLKPYIDIEEIIRVAKSCGAEAIHPGYGFLSERAAFVHRCREEGIIFIGPPAEVMEQLGDKVQAKEIAKKVNVPTIPDSTLETYDEERIVQEANRIGFPIILKAAAGGGGRGMRVVREADGLMNLYREAYKEAATAFGDGTIFLEKFIDDPKHIEVQLLGDQHGKLVHLYERDCSVQRRFQKVVEVAPSVTLSEKTRTNLYEYALKIGREVSYSNAGTVEFLVDKAENIYFIEVNPRVQVEHTITEEITGIDIVRSQILIAMGYPLSHKTIFINDQSDIEIRGYAIQCRVTTEDPSNNFKPDYGTLIAYRSASGFGIRLDAGSAYTGSSISPFFDSLLVKVTASGRTVKGAAERLHRALMEFRIRGVKTNIGYLLNLLEDPTFKAGEARVNFIADNPQLMKIPMRRDRGTKLLKYLANVIVNGHPDVKKVDPDIQFLTPKVPAYNAENAFPNGTKDKLTDLGPEGFAKWLKDEKRIQFTDTTFRDAHQSLLATRMRTIDLIEVAESFSKNLGDKVFSMEVWGGATFDVAMRFLKEDPWHRLQLIRKAVPNVLLQMLLRGSNAVGYKAYPDNLIQKFVEDAWKTGIDIFRIFDSLNWVESLKTSIKTVRERTEAIAEACICYTGDVSNPKRKKYDLQYYVDLAKRLEDEGAHILAIKDMAGLLKPAAAEILIPALQNAIDLPIHLHTHDTSGIQSATYLTAIKSEVDVVDVAISSMSGLTSQPSFNSMVALMQGQHRDSEIDLHVLNAYSEYWEQVRRFYYPFESELKASTADVYDHEIPGGQYSNLRPQARGLGLEDQFDKIKENYKAANELFGDLVKVTPSSKVVGDMAMFMTSNGLSKKDILEKGNELSFPDSVKTLFRGNLGQPHGGFPFELQQMVLKDEKPFTDRPNAHLKPIEFESALGSFRNTYGQNKTELDFLSSQLYPKVYDAFHAHFEEYGVVWTLPTPVFFYGLKPNKEIIVKIGEGKDLLVQYINTSETDETGHCKVFFNLNGQTRVITVKDNKVEVELKKNKKVEKVTDIGAPLQGSLSKILVKVGDLVSKNQALFTIEAMKMESTVTAPMNGEVRTVVLGEKTLVEQDDLVLVLDPSKDVS